MTEKNGSKVSWSQLGIIIGIAVTIISVLWNEIAKANEKIDMVDDKITEVKIDTSVLKVNLGNLIERINGGQVTIKLHD